MIHYRRAPKRKLWCRAGQKPSKVTTSGKVSTSVSFCRGALEPKFCVGFVPSWGECWAFINCASPSLVKANFEGWTIREKYWLAMHAGTMAPVVQRQSSKDSHRCQPLETKNTEAREWAQRWVRGIWGELLEYWQHFLPILLHYMF